MSNSTTTKASAIDIINADLSAQEPGSVRWVHRLVTREYGEAVSEERWQTEHKQMRYLEERGFEDPDFVPLFSLDTMEEELTMEQAALLPRHVEATHRMTIPVSMATPAERRQAREADIDDMKRREWDHED